MAHFYFRKTARNGNQSCGALSFFAASLKNGFWVFFVLWRGGSGKKLPITN
jgi:hypothetical protein